MRAQYPMCAPALNDKAYAIDRVLVFDCLEVTMTLARVLIVDDDEMVRVSL